MSGPDYSSPARVPGRAVSIMKAGRALVVTPAAQAAPSDAPSDDEIAAAAAVAYASWFEVSVEHAAADLADAAPNDRAMLRWRRLGRAVCVAIRQGLLK